MKTLPYYDKDLADKLVVFFRRYIDESKSKSQHPEYKDNHLFWKMLQKLEDSTDRLALDGMIR